MTAKILRIMELALLLNPTKTEQEYTGEKPTVFAFFSGHIPDLTVDIHANGWKAGQRPDITIQIYADGRYNSEKQADECITFLESLLEKWGGVNAVR